MTTEPPKVSTEDEAKQIFEAARLNIGGTNDSSPTLGSEGSPVRNGAAVPSSSVDVEQDEPDSRYSKDSRLKVVAIAEVPDGDVVVLKPTKVRDRVPGDIMTASDGDNSLAKLSAVEPTTDVRQAAADDRLKESPRDALRRLQTKADDARRAGLLE